MLSFMNRTTRRKAKKVDITSIRRVQSPPSPEPFASADVVDIREKFDSPRSLSSPRRWNLAGEGEQDEKRDPTRLDSPKVQLNLSSEPLSTFFPAELLRDAPRPKTIGQEERLAPVRKESRSALVNTPKDIVAVDPGTQAQQYTVNLNSGEESRDHALSPGRRPPPAPIQIPTVSDSKFQIHRSAAETKDQLHPYAAVNGQSSGPDARVASSHDGDAEIDNLSTISGTTLARALMVNSFILTSSDSSRNSRYRSGGISRQDSATLPRGENPLLNSPYWRDRRISSSGEIVQAPTFGDDADIPPVPPMPGSALGLDIPPSKWSRPTSGVGESDEEGNLSDTQISLDAHSFSRRRSAPRLHPNEPLNIRRISRISEGSSTGPNTPEHSNVPTTAGSSPGKSGDASYTSPSHYNSPGQQDSTPPSSAPPSSVRPPPSEVYSAGSGDDIDHVLDDYQFLSPMDTRFLGPQSASSSKRSGLSPKSVNGSRDGRRRSKSQQRDCSLSGRAAYSGKPELNITRARSDSRVSSTSKDKHAQRPVNLLPIGERPRSTSIPQPPLPPDEVSTSSVFPQRLSRTSKRTVSRSSTHPDRCEDPLQSPDLLDTILLPVTRSIFTRQRSGSTPSPIRVVQQPVHAFGIPIDEGEGDAPSPSTSGGHQQTFPETPRLFSPMWTPDPASAPPVPAVPPLIRRVSVTAVPEARHGAALVRAATASAGMLEVPGRPRSVSTPVVSAESESVSPNAQVITFVTLEDVNSIAVHTPLPASPLPDVGASWTAAAITEELVVGASSSSPVSGSSQKNSSDASLLDPTPQAQAPPVELPPSPPLTILPTVARRAPLPRPPRTPPEEPSTTVFTPTFAPPPPYQAAMNDPPVREAAAPEYNPPQSAPASRRQTRHRPPLPIGPRRPSQGTFQTLGSVGRERNGSVSSLASNAHYHQGGHGSGASVSSPLRFQTVPVGFRGYTIDMAKWSFTSEQLQSIVSRAIVQSSQASSIRILSLDVLDNEIPAEMGRLENLSGELKTRYKLLARKRTAILGNLAIQSDHVGSAEYSPRLRSLEDLTETCASLDQVVEELHLVNDQIYQLKGLIDVHSSSALAMALRKLNTSWAKKVAESESLRARVATLEAERDEAWKQAEAVAHDYDDLQDRMNETAPGARTPSSAVSTSRRSSRVLIARKTSLRASKAGLRASTSRRSQRFSSGSSQRASSIPISSAARSTFSSDDVPPVPPIPRRRPGIITADLTSRSSMGISSEGTVNSVTRTMVEAQLCDMLGIAIDELDARASRRLSSASLEDSVELMPSTPSPRLRRASLPANASDLGKIYDAMTNDPTW